MRSNKVNALLGQKIYDPLLLPIATGIVIRRVREAKNLTQSDLATKSDMNVSYISNVENGQNNMSIVKLSLISHGLGVLPDAVLGRAQQLLEPLHTAIRNRTPREAERMMAKAMPVLLDVGELIRKGFGGTAATPDGPEMPDRQERPAANGPAGLTA